MKARDLSTVQQILRSTSPMFSDLSSMNHYSAKFKFKQVFRQTLRAVKAQYPAARFDVNNRGMTLQFSPPLVVKRLYAVSGSQRCVPTT